MKNKFLIGMVYLPPSPHRQGHLGIEESIKYTIKEVQKLVDAKYHGALLENEFDRPYEIIASDITVKYMKTVCRKVRDKFPHFNLGVEFLINDPKASLDIAKFADFNFIRTDYFVDPMSRAEYGGLMSIDPQGLMDYRREINSEKIKIYTDLQVKYAKLMVDRTLKESARLADEYQSDGFIISGTKSGEPPTSQELAQTKIGKTPVIIGSGLSLKNLASLIDSFDGAIVGTSIMDDGVLNTERVNKLAKAFGL